MNREVSIFLDLARFLAAFVVFLSHASWTAHTGGVLWQIKGLGREAVDVFFVLSGFVISHVIATREGTARSYAVNRLARILSVALPALCGTWLLDAVGMAARPELYGGFCCEPGSAWWSYPRNLVFLGDVWSRHVSPGSNVPYWSLGYEAWYYLSFGLATFLPRRIGVPAAVGAMVLAGPGIAVLFPLWLLGVGCRGWSVSPGWGRVLMGLGAVGAVCIGVFGVREGQIYDPFSLSAGRLIDYAHDYAMGLCFMAFLLGFAANSGHFAPLLRTIERPVRWLAGGTFALYLFHLPLLHFLAAVMPFPALSWRMWACVYAGVPVAGFLLAEVTERRKGWWRARIDRLFAGGA